MDNERGRPRFCLFIADGHWSGNTYRHTEMAQKLISAYIRARPQNKYICYILLRFLSVTDTVSDPSDRNTYFTNWNPFPVPTDDFCTRKDGKRPDQSQFPRDDEN